MKGNELKTLDAADPGVQTIQLGVGDVVGRDEAGGNGGGCRPPPLPPAVLHDEVHLVLAAQAGALHCHLVRHQGLDLGTDGTHQEDLPAEG